MQTKYCENIEKILQKLSEKIIMVLATSADNIVTARSMSVVLIHDRIYFQTDKEMFKTQQILKNKNVALCVDNFQITGEAKIIGTWNDCSEIKEKYIQKHAAAFERYKNLDKEIVVEVKINTIEMWEYIDNKPYIINAALIQNEYKKMAYCLD